MDSHLTHLKGIWNKTVKEQKNFLLLQEHQMKFNHHIDKVTAKVESHKWKDLGFDLGGTPKH
jgi:hypothetical protein